MYRGKSVDEELKYFTLIAPWIFKPINGPDIPTRTANIDTIP
jgi:hypothetical protein